MYIHTHTHTHTQNTHIHIQKIHTQNTCKKKPKKIHTQNTCKKKPQKIHTQNTCKKKPKHLHRLEVKRRERTKEVNKATKNIHRQSTLMGDLQTQKLRLNKIKITYQNNLYYKKSLKQLKAFVAEWLTQPKYKHLKRTNMPETRVVHKYIK